jgi:hypothetical protein
MKNGMEITFKSLGGWSKHKFRLIGKENQTLTAVDKCLTRIPDMRTKILGYVYEMICES